MNSVSGAPPASPGACALGGSAGSSSTLRRISRPAEVTTPTLPRAVAGATDEITSCAPRGPAEPPTGAVAPSPGVVSRGSRSASWASEPWSAAEPSAAAEPAIAAEPSAAAEPAIAAERAIRPVADSRTVHGSSATSSGTAAVFGALPAPSSSTVRRGVANRSAISASSAGHDSPQPGLRLEDRGQFGDLAPQRLTFTLELQPIVLGKPAQRRVQDVLRLDLGQVEHRRSAAASHPRRPRSCG